MYRDSSEQEVQTGCACLYCKLCACVLKLIVVKKSSSI